MREFLPLAVILALFGSSGQAQSVDQIVKLDVIPGWTTSSGTHMAGLRVTLAPGWKTYWRAPGDAGIPPQFSFGGSSNISDAEIHWPIPSVFHQGGMRSIGYHDGVVIPVELTPTTAGAPIQMSGEINIGVCEEICVPVTLSFDANLPVGGDRDGAITAALINQPADSATAGLTAVTCAVTALENGMRVTATIPGANGTTDVVIEAGNPEVWVSEPVVTMTTGHITATADMVHITGSSFALDRSAIRITLLGGAQAIDIQGCVAG